MASIYDRGEGDLPFPKEWEIQAIRELSDILSGLSLGEYSDPLAFNERMYMASRDVLKVCGLTFDPPSNPDGHELDPTKEDEGMQVQIRVEPGRTNPWDNYASAD